MCGAKGVSERERKKEMKRKEKKKHTYVSNMSTVTLVAAWTALR